MIDVSWRLNQQNRVCFVMVNAAYTEVPGLGAAINIFISKNGGPFVAAAAGTEAEIGNGWYTYLSTAAEADTIGPVAIYVTGAGCLQQNLVYQVESLVAGAIAFTYVVTDIGTGAPIDGVQCWFCTDVPGLHMVWVGFTDAFGVARDSDGNLPFLDAGVYYIFRQRVGYTFIDPDIETVSIP